MSESTRWTIILGAADGEPVAQEEFARRYTSVIHAYLGARWRASSLAADIDDATQEVFLECFRKNGALRRAEPDRGGGFRAYLYGVVRNVARRFEERRARRRERQAPSDFDVASGEEPLSRVFDRAWATALLRQAFARLQRRTTPQRVDLLRLRYVEGKSLREIADASAADPKKLQYESSRAIAEFEAALLEVVREHLPQGGAREECARLLQHFS